MPLVTSADRSMINCQRPRSHITSFYWPRIGWRIGNSSQVSRFQDFDHGLEQSTENDYGALADALRNPLRDWKRPSGRPATTWLSIVKENLMSSQRWSADGATQDERDGRSATICAAGDKRMFSARMCISLNESAKNTLESIQLNQFLLKIAIDRPWRKNWDAIRVIWFHDVWCHNLAIHYLRLYVRAECNVWPAVPLTLMLRPANSPFAG